MKGPAMRMREWRSVYCEFKTLTIPSSLTEGRAKQESDLGQASCVHVLFTQWATDAPMHAISPAERDVRISFVNRIPRARLTVATSRRVEASELGVQGLCVHAVLQEGSRIERNGGCAEGSGGRKNAVKQRKHVTVRKMKLVKMKWVRMLWSSYGSVRKHQASREVMSRRESED